MHGTSAREEAERVKGEQSVLLAASPWRVSGVRHYRIEVSQFVLGAARAQNAKWSNQPRYPGRVRRSSFFSSCRIHGAETSDRERTEFIPPLAATVSLATELCWPASGNSYCSILSYADRGAVSRGFCSHDKVLERGSRGTFPVPCSISTRSHYISLLYKWRFANGNLKKQ